MSLDVWKYIPRGGYMRTFKILGIGGDDIVSVSRGRSNPYTYQWRSGNISSLMFTFDTSFSVSLWYTVWWRKSESYFFLWVWKTFISPDSVYVIVIYRQLSKNNGGSNILDGYANKSDRMCTGLCAYGERFKSSGRFSMPYIPWH
jgi:hypothetical protein